MQSEFDRVLLKHEERVREPNKKKVTDILPQTNIRSVKGNNLKLHPSDSLDIWLALFLLRHLESQRFSSIQEENEWHQPFVLWAQALISALFWNCNISDHLKQIVCLCIYIEWKPAVCFREVFSFAYVCPNHLTGKTKWRAKKDFNIFPSINYRHVAVNLR